MRTILLAFAVLLVSGCMGMAPKGAIQAPVPVPVSCVKKEKVPVKLDLLTEEQLKALPDYDMVLTLWRDRIRQVNYERDLEAIVDGCVGVASLPGAVSVPTVADDIRKSR